MDDLKFDLYAMVKPQTGADICALLAEVLSELANVHEHLTRLNQTTPGN